MPTDAIIQRQWEWTGILHPMFWAVLWLALAIVTWKAYLRRFAEAGRGQRLLWTLLRLMAYGLLVWALTGAVEHRYRHELPELVVLLDNSLSMDRVVDLERMPSSAGRSTATASSASPARSGQSRFARAVAVLAAAPEGVWSRYRVLLGTLTDAPAATHSPGDYRQRLGHLKTRAEETQLGERVSEIVRRQEGHATAAIVLVTDTMETGGRPLLDTGDLLRDAAIPMVIATIGSSHPARQLEVRRLHFPPQGFLGEMVPIEVELRNLSSVPGEFEITLVNSETGERIERQIISVPSSWQAPTATGGKNEFAQGQVKPVDAIGTRITLALRLREPTTYRFHLEARDVQAGPTTSVIPLQGEQLGGTIDVVSQPSRVLLVDGYPRYEFRYLHNLLKRGDGSSSVDPAHFAAKSILMDADPNWDETAAPSLPSDRTAFQAYDIVVLGDVPPSRLSTATITALDRWVQEDGGGLVLIAGQRHLPAQYRDAPLSNLLPFLAGAVLQQPEPGAQHAAAWRLTELGRETSFLRLAQTIQENTNRWNELPGPRWWIASSDLKPGVMTVVEAGDGSGSAAALPTICWRHHGLGKVVWHGTDDMWWWRFRSDEQFYAAYWTQLFRFLSKRETPSNARVTLVAGQHQYTAGEEISLSAQVYSSDWLAGIPELTAAVRREDAAPGQQPLEPILLRPSGQGDLRFAGTAKNLPEGAYVAELVRPTGAGPLGTTRFAVRPRQSEKWEIPLNHEQLSLLAESTGGRCWTETEAERIWQTLPRVSQRHGRHLKTYPWWNAWPVPLVAAALLCVEWALRQRYGPDV